MDDIPTRPISRRKLLAVSFICLLAVSFVVARYRLAISPEGKYIEDKIGFAGLSYYEFKGGKVFVVLSEDSDRSDGREVYRDMIGTYTQNNGHWMLTPLHDDEPITLKVTASSIRWVNSSGEVEYEIPRLFSIGGRVFRIYSRKNS